MCGIIGYIGNRAVSPLLLEGLSSLEYRGYDSAGIAVLSPDGTSAVRKAAGKLTQLRAALESGLPEGTTGIGHTRWATHGAPTDLNAHPHADCRGEVLVVHNGIVENYQALRRDLTDQGHVFTSQTDTECIPHLIESYISEEYSLEEAARQAANRIRGSNAIAVMSTRDPDNIVAFRVGNAGGIVVGHGDDEMLMASDLPALLPHTNRITYLAAGEMVSLNRTRARFSGLDGATVKKTVSHVPYDPLAASKGEYKHFMLKEINEQPEAVLDGLRGRVSFDRFEVGLEDVPFSEAEIAEFNRIVLVGMGTSLHAAMVGRMWLESLVRLPTEADNSSEFRYRDPVIDGRTLVVSVSQSGETADTLAAMEEAKRKGARQLTLCNYPGTQTTRVADGTILIRAGIEIGVAGSKTFVSTLTALYLLALHIAIKRHTIEEGRLRSAIGELARLPDMLGRLLGQQQQYDGLAARYARHSDFLFLGRGINYPLAMEGALKLKEISYIHAEGYQAGEMKHGPISLIDENMPVVALVPRDDLHEKMLNNLNEAKARGGKVIAVATEGDTEVASRSDDVIYIPEASPAVNPLLIALPMQLLAYHIAVRRGCDVDKPRNLAKSVTVE